MRLCFFLILTLLPAGCQSYPAAVTPTATHTAVPPPVSPTPPVTVPPPATPTGPALAVSAPTPQPTATPNYPIYAGPPIARRAFGVQIHLHREDLTPIFDHLAILGVGWVKAQVSWKLYQPYPDQFSDARFDELDALVDQANARDIAVLLSVSKAPEWSRPTTEMDGPPADNALYRAFMQHLAARYRGRVAAYELWNEPNLQREWNGRPLSAADFVSLIRLGAEGARAADPDARLISGAPAPTGINDGRNAIDDRVYLRQMLEAGVADFVDAIGAHPYGWANPPDSSAANPDTAVPTHNDHPSFFFRDTLDDYAALLDERGITAPIWVTEFGWGSFDGLGTGPPQGFEFMTAVSERQQAIYTLRALAMAQTRDRIGLMILWNLNFGPLLGGDYGESGFSLLRPDGAPRPAYLALQAAPKQ